jgi:hypothetical protein
VLTGYHAEGKADLTDSEDFVDWQWVPKAHMNRFLKREHYEQVIHLMTQ